MPRPERWIIGHSRDVVKRVFSRGVAADHPRAQHPSGCRDGRERRGVRLSLGHAPRVAGRPLVDRARIGSSRSEMQGSGRSVPPGPAGRRAAELARSTVTGWDGSASAGSRDGQQANLRPAAAPVGTRQRCPGSQRQDGRAQRHRCWQRSEPVGSRDGELAQIRRSRLGAGPFVWRATRSGLGKVNSTSAVDSPCRTSAANAVCAPQTAIRGTVVRAGASSHDPIARRGGAPDARHVREWLQEPDGAGRPRAAGLDNGR
jgi:hypothetical protein